MSKEAALKGKWFIDNIISYTDRYHACGIHFSSKASKKLVVFS